MTRNHMQCKAYKNQQTMQVAKQLEAQRGKEDLEVESRSNVSS